MLDTCKKNFDQLKKNRIKKTMNQVKWIIPLACLALLSSLIYSIITLATLTNVEKKRNDATGDVVGATEPITYMVNVFAQGAHFEEVSVRVDNNKLLTYDENYTKIVAKMTQVYDKSSQTYQCKFHGVNIPEKADEHQSIDIEYEPDSYFSVFQSLTPCNNTKWNFPINIDNVQLNISNSMNSGITFFSYSEPITGSNSQYFKFTPTNLGSIECLLDGNNPFEPELKGAYICCNYPVKDGPEYKCSRDPGDFVKPECCQQGNCPGKLNKFCV